MNDIITIKHNGVIRLRSNFIKLLSNRPYLTLKDGNLEGIIDYQKVIDTYKDEYTKELDDNNLKRVHSILSQVISQYSNQKELVEKLRDANNKEDLKNIYSELISLLEIEDIEFMKKMYNSYPDFIQSIMIKEIVKTYTHKKLKKVLPSIKNELENKKFSDVPIHNLMVGIVDIDLTKKSKNGTDKLLEKAFSDELDYSYKMLGSLCFNCSNGYVKKCEKIADYPDKKDIEDYSFIRDGFQWYKDGELEKFIINDCNNYIPALLDKPVTEKERTKLKEGLRLIYLLFFDAETVIEANNIEERNKRLGYK